MSQTSSAQPQDGQAAARADRVFVDILCAVDGTRRSYSAVAQAAVLAGPQGHLALLAVTAVTGSGAYKGAAISPPRAAEILEHAAGIAAEARVSCTTSIDPAAPPVQVILERASGHDLLALGAPAGSRLGAMFVEGVADAALGSLTTPLLAARSLPDGERRFAQHILVASDGLDGSDELVDLAARLGRAHEASVILLHTIGVESHARPHRIEEQARRLQDALGDVAELRVEVGGAAEAIVQAASGERVSLILLGSHGLEGLKALGSVSRQVVHDAHCSVLLVPPERSRA